MMVVVVLCRRTTEHGRLDDQQTETEAHSEANCNCGVIAFILSFCDMPWWVFPGALYRMRCGVYALLTGNTWLLLPQPSEASTLGAGCGEKVAVSGNPYSHPWRNLQDGGEQGPDLAPP